MQCDSDSDASVGTVPGVRSMLTAAIMLLVGPEGIRIPALDMLGGQESHTPISLDLPRLSLLHELARGRRVTTDLLHEIARATSSPVNALEHFIDQLRERDLMVSPSQHEPSKATRVPIARAVALPLPAIDDYHLLHLGPAQLWLVGSLGFELLNHAGNARVCLSGLELAAAGEYRVPRTVSEALSAHSASCGLHAMPDSEFRILTARLVLGGILSRDKRNQSDDTARFRRGRSKLTGERPESQEWQRFQTLARHMARAVDRYEATECARVASGLDPRTRVVAIQQNGTTTPLAVGMLIAHARSYKGGALTERYRFHPDWLVRPQQIPRLVEKAGVFLFSNYNWSHRHNLSISRKVKILNSRSITIHGGPNTPKYEADTAAYFQEHPDVDIVVRGEGEVTLAEILDQLSLDIGEQLPDLSALDEVSGLTYRIGTRIVRTADRKRVDEVGALPSPYLTGLFDDYRGTQLAIIETNRGCPYSCTFCDWGSATNSKVKQFPLDRVFAELEWCATNQVAGIMCADANFGIFERDVEIARKVAELKQRYGYPNGFSVSAAKNNTKHTKKIIEILADAGIMTKGSIGVQSTDANTLAAVHRSNIRLDKYDELVEEFHGADLPLWVDIMFGLPGQSPESFRSDLQGCIDRGVFPRIFMTELLVNSPMNHPEYRNEHAIETALSPDGSRRLVVSTATMSRSQFWEMNNLRLLFLLGDVVGMLRHLAHYVRSETGIREVDYFHGLSEQIRRSPQQWPTLWFAIRAIPGLLLPPGSWRLVIAEGVRYAVTGLGVPDDEALHVVSEVQAAVMPASGRVFPEVLQLKHDYAAWHHDMRTAIRAGYAVDWYGRVPPLRNYGPGEFAVDDPDHLCTLGLGASVDGDLFGNYELRSPVARWRPVAHGSRSSIGISVGTGHA